MTETNEILNQGANPAAVSHAEEETKKAKKMYPEEDLNNIVRERVRQENANKEKMRAEYEAKLADQHNEIQQLKEHLSSLQKGVAPKNEKEVKAAAAVEGVATPAASGESKEKEMVPAEYLPYILESERQINDYKGRISKAAEQDDEFKNLLQNGYGVNGQMQQAIMHLDNAPAVLKHLLKNKNDNVWMQSATTNEQLIRIANELSDKVEKSISKPHPSEFKPATNVDNATETGDDFDVKAYIKKKRV